MGFSIFKTFLKHGKERGLIVLGEFVGLSTKDKNWWKISWAHLKGFWEYAWNKQARLKILITQRAKRSDDIIIWTRALQPDWEGVRSWRFCRAQTVRVWAPIFWAHTSFIRREDFNGRLVTIVYYEARTSWMWRIYFISAQIFWIRREYFRCKRIF
jgi:hypothetical protein